MKLIVGLGNPGKEYESTRHNIGFIILDRYVNDDNWKEFKNALIHEKNINGEKIIFAKPTTYMNNSGEAVSAICSYYKIDIDDVLIIQDDIDLPLGKYRFKYESSDGGHNGIKSIIKHLNTNKIPRLKIGLAKNENIDTISYVLGKLSKQEQEVINNDMNNYFDIINTFIKDGIDGIKK